MKKSLFFIIICGIFLIAVPLIVKGQVSIPDPLQEREIIDIIDSIMSLLAMIGSGVAVIMIIWAGIQYMTSGGSEQRTTNAKKTLMWAIIGLAILWSANFIIDAIKYLLQGS